VGYFGGGLPGLCGGGELFDLWVVLGGEVCGHGLGWEGGEQHTHTPQKNPGVGGRGDPPTNLQSLPPKRNPPKKKKTRTIPRSSSQADLKTGSPNHRVA